jgi:protoporphyrinogen oxidase
VVVLGAGPAGLGAAYRVRELNRAQVTVIEQHTVVGGNAGSFEWNGQRLDFGSHRLHPATKPAIMADIRSLLGPDLLDRPRHGRIRLRGRWIHFPLKPVDLLLRLDPGFALGSLRDAANKALGRGLKREDTFADVLLANLGPTICRDFYFPYAKKIWGRDPSELSAIQAKRRVSAGSFGKLVRKVMSAVPGFKPPGAGRFYYPTRGFGAIAESYGEAATSRGATLKLGTRLAWLDRPANDHGRWTIGVTGPNGDETMEADDVWSSIPITVLAACMRGGVPDEVTAAAASLKYRAMILVYLTLDQDQFTEFDAHYFPGADVSITRLSEPKNYSALGVPKGQTTLCFELPCDADDATWKASDEDLGRQVANDLATAGLPLARPPIAVLTRRLRQAYPLYLNGYEKAFATLDGWADTLPSLLTFGRQGLFAHDNTHHALSMAYAAAECLSATGFDRAKWRSYRTEFATHVVED